MNIKKAKQQIKNAITAYLTKNEFGEYKIPVQRQRPIFLMGPPGVGKTAIMEQIAAELGIGLVSYSMTHHTRQSALGLPFIEKKIYEGKEFSVAEYTMSEIIASVYDMMAETGVREGILFLDEINCVSETLEPSMLQFLQYKTFGRHRVPDGWIIVTAGNPVEYNKSVREFDVVTWDRLKRVDVEPDYETWKEFAYKTNVHASVLTYLDIKKNNFYKIETTVDGKAFVTARGWTDLSDMIRLCEENELEVDEDLVMQYLQEKEIAKDFAIYYDLFNKYRSDYQISKILTGAADSSIIERARNAAFDERLSLIGLLLDEVDDEMRLICLKELAQGELLKALKKVKEAVPDPETSVPALLQTLLSESRTALANGRKAGTLDADMQYAVNSKIQALDAESRQLLMEGKTANADAFALIKADFDSRTAALKKDAAATKKKLDCLFSFAENAFSDSQEMIILVTELTINTYSSRFLSRYGCDAYFKHSKDLMFYERQKEIVTEFDTLFIP